MDNPTMNDIGYQARGYSFRTLHFMIPGQWL